MRNFLTGLAAVLAIIGGGTGLAAFFGIGPQRRLLGATAHREDASAEVALSASAMERMTAAEDRAAKAEKKADDNAAEMQRMRRKFYSYELWADQHRAWDVEAMTEVETLGGHLRQPPQLVMLDEEPHV